MFGQWTSHDGRLGRRRTVVLSLVRGDLPAHAGAGIDLRDCNATIANATIVGGGAGLRFSGDSWRVFNLIAARCHGSGIESRDAATTAAIARGDATIDGVVLYDNGAGENVDDSLRRALETVGATVLESNPGSSMGSTRSCRTSVLVPVRRQSPTRSGPPSMLRSSLLRNFAGPSAPETSRPGRMDGRVSGSRLCRATSRTPQKVPRHSAVTFWLRSRFQIFPR